MNKRVFAGALAAYAYNNILTAAPSRRLRLFYLKFWLAKLGKKTSVQMGVRFLNGRKVALGDRNVINFGCLLDGRAHPIHIGNDVSIGPEATLLTLGHDPRSPNFEDQGGEVILDPHVWVGYRALILPGIHIGEGAVVGAGAVVTKNVEPFAIVAGNPARIIGDRRSGDTSIRFEYKLTYDPWML